MILRQYRNRPSKEIMCWTSDIEARRSREKRGTRGVGGLKSVPIHSWHNRFPKLLIRYEKKSENYLALVQLGFYFIVYRS
jgi:hypothetical protein